MEIWGNFINKRTLIIIHKIIVYLDIIIYFRLILSSRMATIRWRSICKRTQIKSFIKVSLKLGLKGHLNKNKNRRKIRVLVKLITNLFRYQNRYKNGRQEKNNITTLVKKNVRNNNKPRLMERSNSRYERSISLALIEIVRSKI